MITRFAKLSILSLCLVSMFHPYADGAATKHPVALDDLAATAMADSMDLSPDGRFLAYSFGHWSTYLTDNDIWLVETIAGSTPRKVATGTLPRWSPTGKLLAYYSGEPGDYQIWIFDQTTGKSHQLTHVPGGINPDPYTRIMGWAMDAMALAWSPDGQRIMFASRVPEKPAAYPTESAQTSSTSAPDHPAAIVLTRDTPPEWTLAGIYAPAFGSTSGFAHWQKKEEGDPKKPVAPPPLLVNQLFLLDVKTKHVEQFTSDSSGYFGPAWSPDGRTIVCGSADGPIKFDFGSAKTNLYLLDVASRKKTPLTSGGEVKWQPTWSPDGALLLYLSGAFRGHQQLMLVPATGGDSRNVAESLDRYVEEYRWSSDGKSAFALIKDGVSHPVVRIDIGGGKVQRITSLPASRDHLSYAKRDVLAWQQSDGEHPGGLWLDREDDHAEQLVDLNPQVSAWEIGKQEVISWKNSRGEEIEGVLITPPGYREGETYPMIVDSYPGTSATFRSSPYGGNHAWASRGYVVLFTSGARAPHVWMNPFRSQIYDFAAKGIHGWDVTTDDVMSGVEEMIRRKIADPSRIGLFGFSNGGAIAQMLMTRSDRFKCVVSYAGVAMADLTRSFFASSGFTWEGVVGVTPWQDPQGYVELSSIYRLDKVKVPVLLVDGDLDGDFFLNTVEVYNGLRALNRDVTFVRYPDQSHVLTGWALHDFLERTMEFFDHHLKASKQ